MSRTSRDMDADDMFADTRMSFGDHLEDLRTHLWRAIAGFVVALIISLPIGQPVLRLLVIPVEKQLNEFQDRRIRTLQDEFEKDPSKSEYAELNTPKDVKLEFNRQELLKGLGLPVPAGAEEPEWLEIPVRIKPFDLALATNQAYRPLIKPPILAAMNITEPFMVYFKVCMVCGFVIGCPWIFLQVWSFIAAGLYPHEKRYVNVYLPCSVGLFIAGVVVCEWGVIPNAIRVLLEFYEWIGLEPDLRLNEWLSFALMLPLVFGISFQTPLVMLFLAKLGIMDFTAFRRMRKIAYFVMAIFAAIITPTPDIPTLLFLWVPMCGLYELGIYLAIMATKQSPLDIDVPDSEEVVEV
jgi:sec-independent protein translocase protein TatC